MSLVSVKEEKETNGSSTEQLCCSVSVIYVVMCVLLKDFLCRGLASFNTQRSYRADRTARPCLRGQSGPSVSQQIKESRDQHLYLQLPAAEHCRLTDTNVARDTEKLRKIKELLTFSTVDHISQSLPALKLAFKINSLFSISVQTTAAF